MEEAKYRIFESVLFHYLVVNQPIRNTSLVELLTHLIGLFSSTAKHVFLPFLPRFCALRRRFLAYLYHASQFRKAFNSSFPTLTDIP